MEKIKFNKPALCLTEQINLLKSRNLIINDYNYAENILSNISYYRLSSYMKNFQCNDIFNDGTTFENIVELYNFDRELQYLIFSNLRIIEISLRTKICLQMCLNYGPHWFYDENNFKNLTDYQKIMNILTNEKNLKKDTFIKYYFNKYSSPDLPPFWMISEVLSFGDLSKILSSLNYKDVKQIANNLTPNYLTEQVLINWIHVLTTIRNICAHHSRLWNRKLKIKFSKPKKIDKWDINKVIYDSIYSVCFVIAILLEDNPYNDFENSLKILFNKYENIDKSKMGFPVFWNGFCL